MKKIFCCLGFDALNNTIDSIALITEDGKSFFGEISLDKDRHCFVYNKTTKTARICDVLGNIKTYLADWFQDLIDGPVSWRDIGETNIIKKSNYSFEIWMEDQTCEIIYNNSYLNNPFGSMFSNISNLIYPIPMNMDSLFELSIINKKISKEKFTGYTKEALKTSLDRTEMLREAWNLLCVYINTHNNNDI